MENITESTTDYIGFTYLNFRILGVQSKLMWYLRFPVESESICFEQSFPVDSVESILCFIVRPIVGVFL